MKLYLGLLKSAPPDQTRIFGEIDGKLIDLSLAYAAYLMQAGGHMADPYERAAFYFPETITAFLERGAPSRKPLDEVEAFARRSGVGELCGPGDEKVTYDPNEVRLLPPFQSPEKSFVIGFSDQARVEAMPKAEIPTGFYKLPQTFVTNGAPILWPKFSEEVDADACLALVIGKAGRRIPAEQAWDHVAGVTLLLDITARDINRREGLTSNNLLGKNFPSSTCLGPALLLKPARSELEALDVELSIDGAVKQKFALRNCVFTLEQIIARWSILGIKPGDFLAIGASMALEGDRLQNPAPLKVGCRIRCSSPAIGELSHQVVSSGGLRR
jgi:2-keto-4-pentenoate hydratase/2-oxohepta-3-ene-1,7-dioic acid hydratase in catechol pathway